MIALSNTPHIKINNTPLNLTELMYLTDELLYTLIIINADIISNSLNAARQQHLPPFALKYHLSLRIKVHIKNQSNLANFNVYSSFQIHQPYN